MDSRLLEPLGADAVDTVGQLASGYGLGGPGSPVTSELNALLGCPNPVGLTVRLTHRVLRVGELDGLPAHDAAALAGTLVKGAALPARVIDHAVTALHVAERDAAVATALYDRYLDADADRRDGYVWVDLIDGSCAALRACLVSVSRHPLRSIDTARVLARAARIDFR